MNTLRQSHREEHQVSYELVSSPPPASANRELRGSHREAQEGMPNPGLDRWQCNRG